MALVMHPSLAVHPGPFIKTELMEPRAVRIGQLAESFGVSRQAVSALLNARAALTAEMAIRVEKAFGVRADTLMRMQLDYDMARARSHEADIKVRQLPAAA
jgi:addiction module HigA family antidote